MNSEQRTVSMDNAEFTMFQQWKADAKKRNTTEKLKAMGIKVVGRRQTLVMRRADVKTLVPDEDLVAYGEVYKLKNPDADSKLKTFVTDNEIAAYKDLDPDFNGGLTLDAISAKATEMVAAGKLSKAGDIVDEGDGDLGVVD